MCRVASGHSDGVSNDTGQLAGDTTLRDAPERALGAHGEVPGKKRSRKPWVQNGARQGGVSEGEDRGLSAGCQVSA